MAFDANTNQLVGNQTYYYKGKEVKIVSDIAAVGNTVIVEDSQGNRFPVGRFELMKNSIWNFNFVDEKAIARADELIAEAESNLEAKKIGLKESKNWLNYLFGQFGTNNIDEMNSEQANEILLAKNKVNACQSDKTSAGNELQGWYTHKFILLT